MNVMRVVHRWKNGKMQERIAQLDGQMGEILRDGNNVIYILPGNQAINLEQGAPGGHFAKTEIAEGMNESLYHISVLGQERVAGHDVVQLLVQARDDFRYSYQLWVEKATNMPLKSVMLDDSGATLDSYQFTQIEFGPEISDEELEPQVKGTLLSHRYKTDEPSNDQELNWRLDWVPNGFAQKGSFRREDISGGKYMDSVVFSDGLASFTIFVEPESGQSIPEGGGSMGATTAYTIIHKGMVITVVGEVPAVTAMKVAESLRFLNN